MPLVLLQASPRACSLRDLSASTADTREYAERLTDLRLHQPVFRARGSRRASRLARSAASSTRTCWTRRASCPTPRAVSPSPRMAWLCKIHHAAYDRGVLGVRRGYGVEVRADVLLEVDGPMLSHGIQDVHGWTLELPKRVCEQPDQELLEQRWRVFSIH